MTMPIITVQRRMAEQGRIRLGHKVTAQSKAGKDYTRPAKLDRFRFTSPNERLIREVADHYGGEVTPWDNDGKPEWEVLSDARAIPVIVVKGGFSQWHEFWTRAGCQHRCDGEKDPAGNYCDPEDPNHVQAIEKPTTRLSVMLSDIETLGVWRMESHGWNAAAELPSMAELAMHVGDLVPATLSLADRSSVIEVNGRPQTSRYVVPVLDLHVTKARIVELVGGVGGVPALGGSTVPVEAPPERAALEGAPALSGQDDPTVPDYTEGIAECVTEEELRQCWLDIRDEGHMTPEVDQLIRARRAELATPQEGEPVDAEVVEEDDHKNVVWQRLVAAAGGIGVGMAELQREVEANTGKTVPDATAADLQAVLDLMTTGVVS